MEHYYTVDQISQMLSIHPKTVQRYIREGKLRASKIGKSWRVSGHDLSLFAEDNTIEPVTLPIKDRATSTSVIDIQVEGKDEAYRIITTLNAAMNAKPSEYEDASLATQFIERERTVRLMLWGGLPFMVTICNMIQLYMDGQKE